MQKTEILLLFFGRIFENFFIHILLTTCTYDGDADSDVFAARATFLDGPLTEDHFSEKELF